MAKVLVCLADREEQENVAAALRLKKHTVSAAEPVTVSDDPKKVAAKMAEAKVDVVVLDYIPDDAVSVKMLQEATDAYGAPRFIFVLPEGVGTSHILMAVNEGASAILMHPVNTDALANYIERAVNGPARFRHELALQASAAAEIAEIEQHSKIMRMQLASYRKLVSYLLSTPASSQHRSVLVVSDSAYQRDYLRKVFEDHGFHVSLAENPDSGLEKALESKPRVIVSDLEMEGKNGIEFCRALKIENKLVPCYFVICTANSEKIDTVMAPGNGVDACVLKPSNESDNLELVAVASMGLLL